MSTKDDIINKLREAFVPESLDVTDESHLHEGHAGHRPGGETHFRVYIVSPAFEGKSRIERHRMVNATLDAELKGLRARAGDQGAGTRGKYGPVISQPCRKDERPTTSMWSGSAGTVAALASLSDNPPRDGSVP